MLGQLKIAFWCHAVVALVLGVPMFAIPALLGQWINWPIADPAMTRLAGAAMVAWGVTSVLGALAHEWQETRIVVEGELAFCSLGAVGMAYSLFAEAAPTFAWVSFALFVVFAFVWGYFLWAAHQKPVMKHQAM
jgi:hypothetical protein